MKKKNKQTVLNSPFDKKLRSQVSLPDCEVLLRKIILKISFRLLKIPESTGSWLSEQHF